MLRNTLSAVVVLLLAAASYAQPISRPYPFDIIPLDTTSSEFLDALTPPARMLEASDRLKLGADAHLVDQTNQRVRLFGTSLWYNSSFLPQDDAKKLAVRLRKLGFNAVKLVYNDYFGWDDASFFRTYGADSKINPSSYVVNSSQLARFDTLLFELKRNGIYVVLVLHSLHRYSHGEGVLNWDSTFSTGNLHHFWDTGAQQLQRNWATTLLTHTNPLTGMQLKDDPMIAYVTFNQTQSLYYWWQANRLNYVDEANKLTAGAYTIAYHDSKRLDTLFNRYLLNKYGSQSSLLQAWGGDPNPPTTNLMDNGSFENFNSTAWTFATSNGANAGNLEGDGGTDSSVFAKIRIANLSSNPVYNHIVFYNLTPRLGKDTLYELTFWAKMGYDHANRPGVTTRDMGVLVFSYGTSGIGLNTTQQIDTSWKKYSFTFRAVQSGLHYVYLSFGTEMGDVWLDAFDLHQKAETPLLSHEDLSTLQIDRLKFAALPSYPRARTRDMVMFYDSLERTFYQSMASHLKTTGYNGLVNWTQTGWYSMLPDIYKASGGDIAEHQTGWDYISARPGEAYTDSTWMVRNIPMVKSLSAGTFYNMSANAVAGKAFIVEHSTPWMNQHLAEHLVTLPAFASYQDWDGIFLGPFATFRTDLSATRLPNQFVSEGGFSSLAKNPAVLSLLPSASYAFRNQVIKPASVEDTLTHEMSDVWLYPVHNGYRGFYGVEGYLYPNAATAFRMRQSFGAKTKRVAAEYPYLPDTAVKQFDGDEIVWDQTNGLFTVRTGYLNAGTGFFSGTFVDRDIRIDRIDGGKDALSYYLIEHPESQSYRYFLTASTRAQNSNLSWASDSLSFAKDFGTGPTVLSSATLQLFFPEPATVGWRTKVVVQPLGADDKPLGDSIESWNPVTLDQQLVQSPWFAFYYMFVPEQSVSATASISASLYPNPASDKLTVLASESTGTIRVVNMLGQTLSVSKLDGTASSIDVSPLAPGAYTVIIETANGTKVLPLRKL